MLADSGAVNALSMVTDIHQLDPTIRDKFNTYRFIDYKESVIDLLQRVCTVSVETMKIGAEMNERYPVSR